MYDEIEDEDIFADKKKPKKKRPKYYISNDDMMKELIIAYDENRVTPKLAEYFHKIVVGIAHAPNFINYHTWIDDMKGDALYRMCLAIRARNFDLSQKDKAFSYFTMIAWRAFQARIKIEKKEHNTIEDYKQKVFENFEAEHNFSLEQEPNCWES